MEDIEIPSRPGNFAERFRKIGRKVVEFIADKLIIVPSRNRETSSFMRHKDELTAKIDSDVDVSPQRVLSDTFGVQTEKPDDDNTVVHFEDSN